MQILLAVGIHLRLFVFYVVLWIVFIFVVFHFTFKTWSSWIQPIEPSTLCFVSSVPNILGPSFLLGQWHRKLVYFRRKDIFAIETLMRFWKRSKHAFLSFGFQSPCHHYIYLRYVCNSCQKTDGPAKNIANTNVFYIVPWQKRRKCPRSKSKILVEIPNLQSTWDSPRVGSTQFAPQKIKGSNILDASWWKTHVLIFRIAWKNNRVIGVLSSNHDGRRLLFPSQNSPRKNCIASPPSNLQRLDLWELWLSDQLLRQRSLHLWLSLLDRWKQESMSRHFCSIGVERWHLLMQQRLDHPLGLQRWWGLWLSGLRGRACSHLWILWSLPVDLWSFHVLWWHTARLLHWRCPSTPLRQLSWICHRLRLCGRWRLRLSSMWRWRVYLWRLWSMSSNLWGLRHMRPRSLSWLGYFHHRFSAKQKQ